MLPYSITDSPFIMGFLMLGLLAMVGADLWGRFKDRKPRRRIEGPGPPPNPPAKHRPSFRLVWPDETMSAITAAQVQLGQLRKEWGVGDAEVWVMCLLGGCIEGKGEHFDQMFVSPDGVSYNGNALVAKLREMDANGLDRVMQQALHRRGWEDDGACSREEYASALAGVLADPASRMSMETLRRAMFETDPYRHFLPSLHALLMKRYRWEGAPEGKPFRPGWREKVTLDKDWDRPGRPPAGDATKLLATGYHCGVALQIRAGAVPADAAAHYADAARVSQAFDRDEGIFQSYYDDALQTRLSGFVRARGFERVADEIAARALHQALKAVAAKGDDPRWPKIDRDFDFAAVAEEIIAASDAWFEAAFPWKTTPPRKPRPMRGPKVRRLPGGRGPVPPRA